MDSNVRVSSAAVGFRQVGTGVCCGMRHRLRSVGMTFHRGFASDNNAGVDSRILDAIVRANSGHFMAYGNDPYTERAVGEFRKAFGSDVEVFFVFNGTAANVLGLKAMTEPHHSVLCARGAHIAADECGAPERFTGCKLIEIETHDGKLTPDSIRPYLEGRGEVHHVQPRVISISQTTEMGRVYRPDEVSALSEFAKENDLLLHMDGARILNAAAALDLSYREITRDRGVDVLSFGGTKAGLLFGEAVVFFKPELARGFQYTRKQGMQLASKMRFVSAQFEALLSQKIGIENALHANQMAAELERRLSEVPDIVLVSKREANAVFVAIDDATLARVRKVFPCHAWGRHDDQTVVRLMTAFDTDVSDIIQLVDLIQSPI